LSGFVDHFHEIHALQYVTKHVSQNADAAVVRVIAPTADHVVSGVLARSKLDQVVVADFQLGAQPAPERLPAVVRTQRTSQLPQEVFAELVDAATLAYRVQFVRPRGPHDVGHPRGGRADKRLCRCSLQSRLISSIDL